MSDLRDVAVDALYTAAKLYQRKARAWKALAKRYDKAIDFNCTEQSKVVIAERQRADRLETALRDVLAEYEYQMGPFDAENEPSVIRTAHELVDSFRMAEPSKHTPGCCYDSSPPDALASIHCPACWGKPAAANESDHPECSVCRRRHGREIEHPCE